MHPNRSLILSLICLVLFAGCSTDQREAIIGKWDEIDGPEIIEFFDDGTVIVSNGVINFSGNYQFLDDNRIKIELGGIAALAGTLIGTVSFSDNVMTMTTPNEDPDKYLRVN